LGLLGWIVGLVEIIAAGWLSNPSISITIFVQGNLIASNWHYVPSFPHSGGQQE
jgi:hypothetical protein